MTRLLETQRDVRALSGLTICCIGPRTAEALAAYGLRADVIPEQFQAEGILEVLAARQMRGARVLIPRALVARELLPDQLRAQGADVDVVPVYRTIRPAVATDRLMEQLRTGGIDVISFHEFLDGEELRRVVSDEGRVVAARSGNDRSLHRTYYRGDRPRGGSHRSGDGRTEHRSSARRRHRGFCCESD
jgi:hypothetical protein